MKKFIPGVSKNLSLQLRIFWASLYTILPEAERNWSYFNSIFLQKLLKDFGIGNGDIVPSHGSSCQETSCWPSKTLLRNRYSKMWFIIHASPKNHPSLLSKVVPFDQLHFAVGKWRKEDRQGHAPYQMAQPNHEWPRPLPIYLHSHLKTCFPLFPSLCANFKS